MEQDIFNYDSIIIGAGHAGCEAALALARLENKVLLTTLNLDSIAFLACNPSIGGTAKGQLACEIDALGGQMGVNTDKTMLQFRILNKGKGPAVQSYRAQVDKIKYHNEMKKSLEQQENLDILQAEVIDILIENGKVAGIKTAMGETFYAKSVVVATGVYLNSKVIVGEFQKNSGPNGFEPATKLTLSLINLGVTVRRFKTGTPARIDGETIDYSKFKLSDDDNMGGHFSYLTTKDIKNTRQCFLGYTNQNTHEIIRQNIHRAPMYSGQIKGVGPRYCPSIEDKVMRFSDKERHQLFLEPESADTCEVYVQGISSSLPVDVQRQVYNSIEGLKNAKIMRFAYAIEYDCIDATELDASLQYKKIAGLYFAGQINGTSGYEEAAAQGIVAGINANNFNKNKPPFILKRNEAYIGVLIDDLINKSITEPYRMMTARAEHRLLLRQDNCDLRLTPIGKEIGLVTDKRYKLYLKKLKQIEEFKKYLKISFAPEKIKDFLIMHNETVPKSAITVEDMIKRPNIDANLIKKHLNIFNETDDDILQLINTEIKYEGYIKREKELISRNMQLENKELKNIDYLNLKGLRLEARQKLNKIQPKTLGQASRIDGVSPADINVLIIYLKMMQRKADKK